ncbi:methyl-accepting chemotaxis protein [Ancylothrix sp. C2]|uniref:HAMP domain-containing methyl-accepting chemotaxis protein n=1 Tax=Ancylothrix sp. D3o TaxID=2953691 RepID=UPI0021BAD437|nr:methyl-accepting chemotaxis protein [Ancylothrix sp. D3o]MCT7950049.1 methyl-accepting chemotaxis protein [Ancylothrix sp. D3o]
MLKNTTLQTRLTSAFLFIGLIVLIVGIIGLSASNRLSGHITTLSENTLPSAINLWKVNEGQTRVFGSEKVLMADILTYEQRQTELANIKKALEDIKEGFDTYDKLPRDPEEDKIYKQVLREWDKWTTASDEYLQIHDNFLKLGVNNPKRLQIELLQQGRTNSPEFTAATAAVKLLSDLNAQLVTTLEPTFNTATDALLENINYQANLASQYEKAASSDISQSSFWIIIGLLIGPLTAVLFGIFFSKPIVRKVLELVDVGNKLSSSNAKSQHLQTVEKQDEIGKLQTVFYNIADKIAELGTVAEKISSGDLTAQIQPTDRKDEIGKLQTAFYTMNKNLNALIRRIQQSGVQITTSATQIAASGKQLEATATEQLASTNEVTATAAEIANTSKKLVKMIEQVGVMTNNTATAASNSRDELGEMENIMRQLTEATNSITSKLGVMNKKASNINNVVVTITKVADQTSILSLNAAIEAEKAGEYGAGFAVVAREIRRLANQTAVATLEIEQIVKDMQSAVSVGVMEMDKFNKSVTDSVSLVSKISQQMGKVINQVQSLPPQFEQVNHNMEQQSIAAEQISEAMEQLTDASQQTVDALRETNSALEQLDDAARSLRQEISQFKVQN